MRAIHQRQRQLDSLSSPEAARLLCRLLRELMPEIIRVTEKQLPRFLFAVRHAERRPATNTKRADPHDDHTKSS
jgi:hypothetical protein